MPKANQINTSRRLRSDGRDRQKWSQPSTSMNPEWESIEDAEIRRQKLYDAAQRDDGALSVDWSAINEGLSPDQREAFDEFMGSVKLLALSMHEDLEPGDGGFQRTRGAARRLHRLVSRIPEMFGQEITQ